MRRKTIVYCGVTFLQVTLLGALIYLEYLSGYRAGLAQHLYYKKIYYLTHYFQGVPLYLNAAVLISLTAFIIQRHLHQPHHPRSGLYRYLILLMMLVVFYFLPFFRELNTYVYILITLQCFVLVEVIAIMAGVLSHRKDNTYEAVRE